MAQARLCPRCDSRRNADGRCPRCDRPSRSRRRDDDEPDDDRPPVRRLGYDDEEEDDREEPVERPRRRRRVEREEPDAERDERPRRRARRFNPLWVILPIAGTLVLVAAGILLYVFVLSSGGGNGGPPSEMLAWAPAEANHVIYLDLAALRVEPDLNKGPFAGLNDIRTYGIDRADVVAVMRASGGRSGTVTVIKSQSRLDPQRVAERAAGRMFSNSVTVNGKTYYDVPGQGCLYFPTDYLMVRADTPQPIVERISAGTDGQVVIARDLRAALKRTDGPALSVLVAGNGRLTVGGVSARSTSSWVRVRGGQVEKTGEIEYEDADTARQAESRAGVAAAPNQTVRVSRAGTRVTTVTTHPSTTGWMTLQEYVMHLRW